MNSSFFGKTDSVFDLKSCAADLNDCAVGQSDFDDAMDCASAFVKSSGDGFCCGSCYDSFCGCGFDFDCFFDCDCGFASGCDYVSGCEFCYDFLYL